VIAASLCGCCWRACASRLCKRRPEQRVIWTAPS